MAQKTGNPFLDQDFTQMFDPSKFAQAFQVPGLDSNKLIEAQRKNIEAFTQAQRTALEGVQAIVQRQTEFARKMMDDQVNAMQRITGAGTAEERAQKQAEVAKEAYENAIQGSRELAEMSAKSQQEAFELLHKRVADSFDEVRESMQPTAAATTGSTGGSSSGSSSKSSGQGATQKA
ncbi:phasin family protein [Limimonas halophila]|uniref:Phasin family protein n=1 Tax=Limimonas halophila TaxID=1082479 RepID=A0A1G7KWV2_9PROT|nr:phasin family protein [Limimonas halophila]SDF41727.1 phasin family protein [Limimonas halophila]